jgi:hypothetical protein
MRQQQETRLQKNTVECMTSEVGMYSRINCTKSPASDAGIVSEPMQMSQVRRLREAVCASISVFLQSERWRRHYSSAYVAAAVMLLR